MSSMLLFPNNLLDSLDFNEILVCLSSYCTTDEAKSKSMALLPSQSEEHILRELEYSDLACQLFQRELPIPSAAFELDPKAIALLRIVNACLESSQFQSISALCITYEHLHKYLESQAFFASALFQIVENDPPLPQIVRAIDKVMDSTGEVRSSASPELARIRSDLNRKRIASDRLFYKIQQRYASKGLLGDITETVYDSRRVLAVQAAYKSGVNGIFHGSSGKQTLYYLEPGECIGMNNEVSMLIDDERKEIRRILTQLTTHIAQYRFQLERFRSILVELDFIRAKGLLAHRNNYSLPKINSEGKMDLIRAFNPVLALHNKEKKKKTVPFDLQITEEKRLLIISGPNAGGKSVTLKTIGLIGCMLQSGLCVPADPKSSLCLYTHLLGDIGDSQSIENELSTYSSRLQKMQGFLRYSSPNALILIDEFGSGSDPDLGSALAEEVLERLHESGVRGVITTHYNRIKALASQLDGTINGSMTFNQGSFLPEYQLQTGVPGSSYTFEVARRVGLPEELIRAAKGRLSKNKVRLDGLLTGIQQEKHRLKDKRMALESELLELKDRKIQQEGTIVKLEEKLRRQSEMNETSSRHLMWGKRFSGLVEEWKKAKSKKAKQIVVDRMTALLLEQSGATNKLDKQEDAKAKKREEARLQKLMAIPILVGDDVKLIGTRQIGKVLAVKNQKFQVQFGNLMSTIEREKIMKV